jgi:hypothetical protein
MLLLALYHIFSFGTLETSGAHSDCSAMSSAPKRLVADPITGCFSVVICSSCNDINTSHRCLAAVTVGGLLCGNARDMVCGIPICGICNSEFGNENIIRCRFHSSEKENIREDNVNVVEGKHDKKRSKILGKGTCAAEYSSKDLLILSQAYIRTSENAIEGVSQKEKTSSGMMWQRGSII